MDFAQPKLADIVIDTMGVYPECSEGQNTREQASVSNFQKPIHFYSGFGKTCPCAIFLKKIGGPDRSSRVLTPFGSLTKMTGENRQQNMITLRKSVCTATPVYSPIS